MVLPKAKKPKRKHVNPYTHKLRRGGMGNEQRKGQKGLVVNYISRDRALKKLQLSPIDFRRICILKGIFPRDINNKHLKYGKLYYHIKDIKYIAHEPLLQKYRDIKVYLKKLKKAQDKHESKYNINKLKYNKPIVKLDHIIKERYPTFYDALYDCDDALCSIYLFQLLPVKIDDEYTHHRSQLINKLCSEWLYYIIQSKSLYKTFVSIKGIYYQAKINVTSTQTINITWLIPHKFIPYTPTNIDYKIMTIFLQYYETLLQFVMYKLYNDIQLKYPPTIDNDILGQTNSIIQSILSNNINNTQVKNESIIDVQQYKQADNMQQNTIVNAINNINEPDNTADDNQHDNNNNTTDELTDFHALGGELTPEERDDLERRNVFSGKVFYLCRETFQQSLELIIVSGGGQCILETHSNNVKNELTNNNTITHVIMDRPNLPANAITTRDYIQPQWIYDSFNSRCCLPVEPYKIGVVCPPHLSPFVDNESEGYIPYQAKVLDKWRRLARGEVVVDSDNEQADNDIVVASSGDNSDNDEDIYQRELQAEKSGISYTQAKEQQEQDKQETELLQQQLEQNSDMDNDNDVGDNDNKPVVEQPKPTTTKQSSKKLKSTTDEDNTENFAKMMMSNKKKHLYNAMRMGIEKKKKAIQALQDKREQIEKQRKITAKTGRPRRKQNNDDDNSE